MPTKVNSDTVPYAGVFVRDLEWRVMLKITVFSMFAILFYTSYDLFAGGIEKAIPSLFAFLMYAVVLYLLKKVRKKWVKYFTLFLFISSVMGGFFTMGGYSTVTLLDLMNICLVITILANLKERMTFFMLLFALIVIGTILLVNFPTYIQNNRIGDPLWLMSIHIMLRFVLLGLNSYTIRKEFIKENKVTKELNKQLIHANESVHKQKENLLQMNERLDELVQVRTNKIKELNLQLIDYAYFNAHKVRGPVARILGLINLLRFEGLPEEDKEKYLDMLDSCVVELDHVIREINDTLKESDAQKV